MAKEERKNYWPKKWRNKESLYSKGISHFESQYNTRTKIEKGMFR